MCCSNQGDGTRFQFQLLGRVAIASFYMKEKFFILVEPSDSRRLATYITTGQISSQIVYRINHEKKQSSQSQAIEFDQLMKT